MKRVVAVEGDTITPFGVGSTVRAPVKLGPGEVWVESDGGPGYLGSSVFGSVPISCIKQMRTRSTWRDELVGLWRDSGDCGQR